MSKEETMSTGKVKVTDYIKEVLNDYRIANESREASLMGRREVLTGKAKFGIFGDGKEIAQLAISFGAIVPFIRSNKNSNDFATTADVITEVLNMYKEKGEHFDYACCIYPTAPFVTDFKLQEAYKMLIEKNAETVVPVVSFGFPILRSLKIEDGLIKMNWPEYISTRSQDLAPAYHDCGQFYFIKTDLFLKNKKLFSENSVGYEMPESEVQDIDTEEDWKVAEIKYSFLLERNKGKIDV